MLEKVLEDVSKRVPAFRPEVILDVGANIGRSTNALRQAYKDAIIHAIEPAPEAFGQLSNDVGDDAGIHCHQVALGRMAGDGIVWAQGASPSNRVVRFGYQGKAEGTAIPIKIERGDDFLQVQGISHIDFLTIDAGPDDLEILSGFSTALAKQMISLYHLSAPINHDRKRGYNLVDACKFAHFAGYRLFRIAGQTNDKKTLELRRCQVVFISSGFVARHMRS
jgi:FkbM family methyltransferase